MFADDIITRLVAQGVGTYGSTIFKGSKAKLPDGTGPYLSVHDTGGSKSSKTQNSTATEFSTCMLTARALVYADALSMLVAAYEALGGANGLHNITVSTTFYLNMDAMQPPGTDVGLDALERIMLNFNVTAESVAA